MRLGGREWHRRIGDGALPGRRSLYSCRERSPTRLEQARARMVSADAVQPGRRGAPVERIKCRQTRARPRVRAGKMVAPVDVTGLPRVELRLDEPGGSAIRRQSLTGILILRKLASCRRFHRRATLPARSQQPPPRCIAKWPAHPTPFGHVYRYAHDTARPSPFHRACLRARCDSPQRTRIVRDITGRDGSRLRDAMQLAAVSPRT